ncbi:amidohydrolase family protein [Streptomyces sp. SID8381]|uniref:amidohydrolase n=1 Tax=unclassified Streptomyces TaxID=2593676 RepID=UPI00036E0444|nr:MULTISPECIES: amidohydrolase [unclassified Streptomyces]MYX31088.1 amidohydrolase family protein [Streptomyces sp. SID8381]
MTDFAQTPSGPAAGPPSRGEAVTLARARLGAGGPLAAVRVADGRITHVILEQGDLTPTVAGERVLDLDGRVLLPGLWDAHVHLAEWAAARRRLDLSGTASARQVADRVRAHSRATDGARTVLFGYGFRDGLWGDAPHKRLLDAVLPDRPVALLSADLHAVWLNSACLALTGRGDHPTGLAREREAHEILAALPEAPAETVDAWVAEACRAAAARGVTGVIDFQFGDTVAAWERRSAQLPSAVRVSAAVYPDHLDAAIARGLRTGSEIGGPEGLIRVGPLKLFTDGSLNTRTALCHDPYPGMADTADSHGLEETSPDELVRIMRRAAAHGIEPAVHAIGDRANTVALDAFEAVRCRGRIEHAQLLSPEDLPRFAELGVTAGVQPRHATDDRDVADRHWAGRTARAFAYADLLAAGARLEFGSDAPVSPLDPWLGIASAVSRTDDDRPAWHPEQRLPVRDALAAAARGRRLVRVGDRADLVVVDVDPLTADPATLRTMPVHATMTAGRWTHGPYGTGERPGAGPR